MIQQPLSAQGRAGRQRGVTLIEMMIALTITVFLLAAMLSVLTAFRYTRQTQNGLSQMQDDQRIAMTMLTQIIQSAGYFASVQTDVALTAFPAASVFAENGQSVFGIEGASSSLPDTIYVRYQSGLNDGVLNCNGGTNTSSGTPVTYINAITVAQGTLQLTCALNGGTAQPIVGGVNTSGSAATACTAVGYLGISNIQFLYGMDAGGTGSVTQYGNATAVTNWANVNSIRPTITMLYCTQIGALPTAVPFTTTIALQNFL